MCPDSAKIVKKKIAINLDAYEKLKTFSRLNGLKLRMVIDSMVEIVLEDDEIGKRIANLTVDKESAKSE